MSRGSVAERIQFAYEQNLNSVYVYVHAEEKSLSLSATYCPRKKFLLFIYDALEGVKYQLLSNCVEDKKQRRYQSNKWYSWYSREEVMLTKNKQLNIKKPAGGIAKKQKIV